MADEEDELDITKIPGIVPVPPNCPNWKRSMLEKKNQEKIDEYKVVWEAERDKRRLEREKKRAEEERKRKEEEKWAKLPEWKRKILQEKSRKEEQKKEETEVTQTNLSKQPPPPTSTSKPSNQPPPAAPQTKVPVLPAGPPPIILKKAPPPPPKPEGHKVERPELQPIAISPDSFGSFQDETPSAPPVVVSKITPTPLITNSQGAVTPPTKKTIKVISKTSA